MDSLIKSELSNKEIKLIIALLEMASNSFSNHGCNDFDLKPFFTKEEYNQLQKDYHEWNGDPEEFDPIFDYNMSHDWLLMSYMAYKLSQLLN